MRIASETKYRGRVFRVDVDRVKLPHGKEVTLDIVRHPPSVVLLPMPSPGEIILVRQYRHAVDRFLWELPAGSLDPGETPDQAAARECHEEIGLRPGRLERLLALFPTPGYCDEEMIFYRLTELSTPDEPADQDEDEHLEPRTFTIDAAGAMLARGEIVDMKTVCGLSLVVL